MRAIGWSLGVLVALTAPAAGAEPVRQAGLFGGRESPQPCCPPGYPPAVSPYAPAPAPAVPGAPDTTVPPELPPETGLAVGEPTATFAQAPEAGAQPAAAFNPNMFGDLIGFTPFQNGPIGLNGSETTPVVRGVPLRIPVPGGFSGFKITDNESPRPQDRVFFSFNYFNKVNGGLGGGVVVPDYDLRREVIGFEKACLGGDASFGLRLPFVQLDGLQGVENNIIGDLSFILKFAAINNPATGNVFSGGMVVTAPTGEIDDLYGPAGGPHSTLLQPWMGYIYNLDGWFSQGFSSIVVPTDDDDVTILFNSVGVGCHLYRNPRDRWVRALVPVVEVHVNTPLNHRDARGLDVFFRDQVNMTGGMHVVFPRSTLGVAMSSPLVGPRPYEFEAIAHFNFRF